MKKLFDIQTGEYLELGKDWLDGGEYVCTALRPQIIHGVLQSTLVDMNIHVLRYSLESKNSTHKLNTEWNSLFKDCVYGDRYVLIGKNLKVGDVFQTSRISNCPYKKWNYGSVFYIYSYNSNGANIIDLHHSKYIHSGELNGFGQPFEWIVTKDLSIYDASSWQHFYEDSFSLSEGKVLGNLLEEYSKFTRDEENKLLEFEKLLGFNK